MTFKRVWGVVGVMVALCAGGCGVEAVVEPAQAPPVDLVRQSGASGSATPTPRYVTISGLRAEIARQRRNMEPGMRIDWSIRDLIHLQLDLATVQLEILESWQLQAKGMTGACR